MVFSTLLNVLRRQLEQKLRVRLDPIGLSGLQRVS